MKAGAGDRIDAQTDTVFDGRALRDAFGSFATGVTIVTTLGPGGDDIGLTANSFSSVSLEPPLVLWSLARTASSIEAFCGCTHFAVHVLSEDQERLSTRFASRGIDRFEGLALERGPGGIPMLPDCVSRFACRLTYQYEGGDHVIFVGEVLSFSRRALKPLVFHGGRYGLLLPRQVASTAEPADALSNLSPDDLLHQVSNAYLLTRRAVIDDLERCGWTADEYAALSIAGQGDGLCTREIAALSERYRGQAIPVEVLRRLVARGLLWRTEVPDVGDCFKLTPEGRVSVMALSAIRKASEAVVQGSLDASEVQLLKHLLSRLGTRPTHEL